MTAATLAPEDPPATATRETRIAVWDLPTRVFHWSLAAAFAGAFLSAESERWRDVHVMLGYSVLGLIAFRLVWGLVGSRYARFAAFVAGPARLAAYARSLFSARPERHVGHNPAGALAILLLLGLGLGVGISGWAALNEVGGDWLEDLHAGVADAMLAVVAVHVLGVIVSSLLHRENLVAAMITGDKTGAPEAAIDRRHRVLGVALLLAVIGFWGAWNWDGWASRPAAAVTADAGRSARDAGHERDDD